MIQKIKSKLSACIKSRQLRLATASVLTALTIATATLLNCSIHTIKIFDGKKTYTVHSLNNNVATVMDNIELESQVYEIVETETCARVTSVTISYGFPVYITQGNDTTEVLFCGGTVKQALEEAGFTPNEFDFTEPSLDTEITDTTYIDYTDIEYVTSTKQASVPFKTKTVYSGDLKQSQKKVTTKGADGVNEVTTTVKMVNGVSVETKTDTKVVKKPVTQITTVGTKITKGKGKYVSTLLPAEEIELDENGVPVNYKSKMKVRATAYTHTGNRCSTGVKPQPGYIAVNPKVIPYGTKMFIKTTDGKYIYGYAVAADTGGFIKKHPTGIDLFFDTESECRKFGVRTAEIYILE